MSDREKEIQKLCKGVLGCITEIYYNPNGADTSTCPLCLVRVDWAGAEMSELQHKLDCAYLIAKDLSTSN